MRISHCLVGSFWQHGRRRHFGLVGRVFSKNDLIVCMMMTATTSASMIASSSYMGAAVATSHLM
jgi:hypothetical protein